LKNSGVSHSRMTRIVTKTAAMIRRMLRLNFEASPTIMELRSFQNFIAL
jgi:hypothetical protein